MNQTGFTLIELLVSVTIFTIIILGVYAFFDQGNWLYLQSENRSGLQDNARILMESLEHDLRMAGSKTPRQGIVGGGTIWQPFIFTAGRSQIYFRSDLDSANGRLMANAASGASSFTVENPETICPDPGTTEIVIVRSGRQWEPEVCSSADDSTNNLTISGSTSREFDSATGEIVTPEHIFYRLQDDADADGICDLTKPPYCDVQRAIVYGNDPTTDNDATTAPFQTIATNIYRLNFSYSDFDGTDLGTPPLTGNSLFGLGRVKVIIEARDYASGKVGDASARVDEEQAIVLTSEILVRARF